MPDRVPPLTNWLTITDGQIGVLCGSTPFLKQIWNLNLSRNDITGLCEPLTMHILSARTLRWIDLSGNLLTKLSKQWQHQYHVEKIWLLGNRFHCHCKMLWMANWLANSTTPTGDHIVQDYKHVLCHSGSKNGSPIYTLTAKSMNCLPYKVPAWGIALISGAGLLAITLIIVTAVIAKRWNEVKFFVFIHFNILNKNDEDIENLEGIKFDGLLSYT